MRTDGARAFASEVNADAEAVQRLGRNTEAAGRSMSRSAGRMRSMSSVSSAMGRNLQTVQRGMTGVGVAIGGMGTLALKTGIQFNATMESQTTAFTGFLGSTAKAKAYLNDLYKIAAKTPFEFEDVVAGTRNLMAFGMSAKESKGMISDLGNAIAATGASGEAVKHATFALGQIQAAGTLHGGDLNQLVQAGVVSVPKLAKAMGKSNEGFRKDMSKNKITSEDFFKSMRKQWSEDPMYKGAAAKQAKTFMGQLSTLHDYVTQTLGTITKPLFDALSKNVLPSVTKLTQDIARIWKRTDISVEDKLGLTKSAIDAKLQPLVDAFKNWWTKNNVTERLQQQFYSAMGALTRAAEASAPKVAEAFLNAWLRAPTWAKVASGA
jgi:tape measure domain-containing protein